MEFSSELPCIVLINFTSWLVGDMLEQTFSESLIETQLLLTIVIYMTLKFLH